MVKCKWRRVSPPKRVQKNRQILLIRRKYIGGLRLNRCCDRSFRITHLPTWTIFKKCTFGHSGKYVNHRIHAIFLIGLHIIYHIQAKCHKFAIEKFIHKKHLTCLGYERERETKEGERERREQRIPKYILVCKFVCSINYFEYMLAYTMRCGQCLSQKRNRLLLFMGSLLSAPCCACECDSAIKCARKCVCVGPRVSLTSENCVIIKNLVSDSALFLVSPFWLYD